MSDREEDRPHIVYPVDQTSGPATMFPDHKAAFDFWKLNHDAIRNPLQIAVRGRETNPFSEIVDVNE